MAIYHFHVTQISRGKGQTAVSAAAYRAGERQQKRQQYTNSKGVLHCFFWMVFFKGRRPLNQFQGGALAHDFTT